ncbi:MAG: hypothetical protein GKC03_08085 [Methanomassiliicoccales archaeon]|nr:hypothetical protein [Methanomassiliicoccales archaeon]NYT15824.1 hypothetical protein [Methanomassiliicoccales archaeon]
MRIAFKPKGNEPRCRITTPNPLAQDKKGIGGFIESILAIMIVTSGLLILTLSFYIIAIDDVADSELDSRCQELMNLVLDDSSLLIDEGVIEHSALAHINLSKIDIENEFKLVINELSPESTIVLGENGSYIEGERCCLSMPINVYHSPKDVRPALLRVWTW